MPGPHDRPQPDGSDVRPLVEADDAAASAVLAAAFASDPLLSWGVRPEATREASLRGLFGVGIRHHWRPPGSCLVEEHHRAVAIWLPPGDKHGYLQQLRMLPPMVNVLRRNTPRMMRLGMAMDGAHPKQPCYYLSVLGVAPEWQGRGYGAALMQPVLDRCDADGVGAYLEATSPRNKALYERHGFVARDPLTVGDSPPTWPMWRDPQGR